MLRESLSSRGYSLHGCRIAVLGVSYKRNVDDARESPFFPLRDILTKEGAELNVFDSWYTKENTVDSVDECLDKAKGLVIVTEHTDLIDRLRQINLGRLQIEVIIDGRNCLDEDLLKGLNISYRGIGRRALDC